MSRKMCLDSRQRQRSLQVDAPSLPSRIKFIRSKKNSFESIFTCVTDISDTGTYEIEISERESRESGSAASVDSRNRQHAGRVRGKESNTSPNRSHNRSQSLSSEQSEKCDRLLSSERRDKNVYPHYSCLCRSAKPNVDLVPGVSKVTYANDSETDGRESKLESTGSKENVRAAGGFYSGDTEKKSLATSSCHSTLSAASCNSAKSVRSSHRTSLSSNSTSSDTTSSSNQVGCKCNETTDGNSDTYTVSTSMNDRGEDGDKDAMEAHGGAGSSWGRSKKTVTLGLIHEEKDDTVSITKCHNCTCEINKYDERIKQLENLYQYRKPADEEDRTCTESITESRSRPCDCSTTLSQFVEIRERVEALEKKCFGQKIIESRDWKKDWRADVDSRLYRDDEKTKNDASIMVAMAEDYPTSSFDIFRINQRLRELEKKTQDSFCNLSRYSSQDTERRMTKGTNTCHVPQSFASITTNKEVQVAESNEIGSGLSVAGEIIPGKGSAPGFWVMKKVYPWDRLILKDEAIQTPSSKEIKHPTQIDKDVLVRMEDIEPCKPKHNGGRIHMCKECDHYIAQKLGAQNTTPSLEKIQKNTKAATGAEEDMRSASKMGQDSISRMRRSLNLHGINASEFLGTKVVTRGSVAQDFPVKESTVIRNKKGKQKESRRCSKGPKRGVETEIRYVKEFPWHLQGEEVVEYSTRDRKRREGRKICEVVRLPHESFRIYESQEVSSQRLVLNKEFPNHRPRKARPLPLRSDTYPAWSTPRNQMRVLYDGTNTPFRSSTEYESQKSTTFTVTTNTMWDASCAEKYEENLSRKKSNINPFRYLQQQRKVKVPVLFEEVCNTSEGDRMLQHNSSVSIKVVQLGHQQGSRSNMNPIKKLVRKLSHSNSLEYEEKRVPLGLDKCCCDNLEKIPKKKASERRKKCNLVTLMKRTWVHPLKRE